MRAVDIFGLAVAVLIALIAQIVEPYSSPWWAGMLAAGAIAVASGFHIAWNNLPKPAQAIAARVIWRPTGYLQYWIGIVLVIALISAGYAASHGFVNSASLFASLIGPQKPSVSPVPPPASASPPKLWVTREEIDTQRSLGRTLLVYRPAELIDMEAEGQDVEPVMDKNQLQNSCRSGSLHRRKKEI